VILCVFFFFFSFPLFFLSVLLVASLSYPVSHITRVFRAETKVRAHSQRRLFPVASATIVARCEGYCIESIPLRTRKRLEKKDRSPPLPSHSEPHEDAAYDDSNDPCGGRFLFHRTRATSVDSSVNSLLSSRGTFIRVLEIPRWHRRRSIAPFDFRVPVRTKKTARDNFIGQAGERRHEVADKNE